MYLLGFYKGFSFHTDPIEALLRKRKFRVSYIVALERTF